MNSDRETASQNTTKRGALGRSMRRQSMCFGSHVGKKKHVLDKERYSIKDDMYNARERERERGSHGQTWDAREREIQMVRAKSCRCNWMRFFGKKEN